ncbi:3-deoxy-D-manno-octulosonic-acid transferase [uncultured Desulfatiglans sp.]|uniref:3-deoxy-D-manno-octulosonic acid transferase n=1 Tax=Uncultured Desulfatiglans sp. TaxID=1748965 RepID=A0A653A027_UNCDX|nr:3-deoxy-D-manno-octulosonic-acid transferase [uncultured Desulfatiglans sp.]
MLIQCYAILGWVLFYCLAPLLLWIPLSNPRYRVHFRERLGLLPLRRLKALGGGPRFWIHAVSLGEVKVAEAFAQAIRRHVPDAVFVVSTITPHGRRLAEEVFREQALVVHSPLDAAPCVKRALKAVRPDVLVLLETEIWPLWVAAADRMHIRTAIVNGRISARSIKRYVKLRAFFRPVLERISLFSMITAADRDRILAMGAPRERVVVSGNAKYDLLGKSIRPEDAERFRRLLSVDEGQPVVVAGSTRTGEEETLLKTFRRVREVFPEAVLVIAPRHLERVREIEALVKRSGFSCELRTGLEGPGRRRTAPVVILDTFGELFGLYSIATLAFCGASLVPLGGQNPLEPAAWGKMVLYGPSMDDFSDARALLEAAGAGETVHDGDELAERIIWHLAHPEASGERAAKGRQAVLQNLAAAERHALEIVKLTGPFTL